MSLHVSIASSSDLDELSLLADEFRGEMGQKGPTREEFQESFSRLLEDPGTEFYLARNDEGVPVGYVLCRFRYSAWTSGIDAELEDVFVRAFARYQGIGRQLLRFVLTSLEKKGCRLVGLNTNERNVEALELYRAAGFQAERQGWDGGRQLWLEKRFDPPVR